MNPKSQYVEDQTKQCREHWFKDHKAEVLGNTVMLGIPPCMVINWQNPKSWNYGCRFIIHRRWLCVVGDIGEATYGWGQDLTLEFFDGMDFGYFHSKCCSSETGGKFEGWNPRFCISELTAFLEGDERRPSAKAKLIEEAKGFTSNSHEWTEFLYRGDAKLRDDDYTLADAGSVPHPRAIGHFVGLQMAIKQLKESA